MGSLTGIPWVHADSLIQSIEISFQSAAITLQTFAQNNKAHFFSPSRPLNINIIFHFVQYFIQNVNSLFRETICKIVYLSSFYCFPIFICPLEISKLGFTNAKIKLFMVSFLLFSIYCWLNLIYVLLSMIFNYSSEYFLFNL